MKTIMIDISDGFYDQLQKDLQENEKLSPGLILEAATVMMGLFILQDINNIHIANTIEEIIKMIHEKERKIDEI